MRRGRRTVSSTACSSRAQIAANTNNGIGIAGLTTGAKILPVRVLGKCGGTFDDILAGMLWASGVPIAGVPPNTNPAKVINLSLGGFGACDQSMQEAIDDALAQGAVVVAAAGNASLECRGLRARELQRRDHRRRAHAGRDADQLFELRRRASTCPHPAATCRSRTHRVDVQRRYDDAGRPELR